MTFCFYSDNLAQYHRWMEGQKYLILDEKFADEDHGDSAQQVPLDRLAKNVSPWESNNKRIVSRNVPHWCLQILPILLSLIPKDAPSSQSKFKLVMGLICIQLLSVYDIKFDGWWYIILPGYNSTASWCCECWKVKSILRV